MFFLRCPVFWLFLQEAFYCHLSGALFTGQQNDLAPKEFVLFAGRAVCTTALNAKNRSDERLYWHVKKDILRFAGLAATYSPRS